MGPQAEDVSASVKHQVYQKLKPLRLLKIEALKGQVPGHRAQVTGHRSRAHAARVASRTLQRRLGSRGRRIFLENPGGPS